MSDQAAPERTFRLVGAFAVARAGRDLSDVDIGSRKARQLLKLLVVERGRTVSTDRIVELLWADRPPHRPVDNVATLVSRLRARLGRSVVVGTRGGYALGPAAGAVDLDEAARLVGEAAGRVAGAEPGLALAAAGRALAILGAGAVLADEPYAGWADPARTEAAGLLRRARLLAAEAALSVGEPAEAAGHAAAAIEADPLDEPGYRLLMLAHQRAGEPARALAAYERLRGLLGSELGTDPAAGTRALHLAILRDHPADPPGVVPRPVREPGALVGRAAEAAELGRAWSAAVGGAPAVLLVGGVAGIGKTRLAAGTAELVERTGGLVLRARCYQTERSLFLQPLVEAVRGPVAGLPPGAVAELAAGWEAPLAGLVAELAAALGRPPEPAGTAADAPPEVQRRRSFEALTVFLRRLADRSPVLLLLDDLHDAGLATVEYLHYLARHLGHSRLLVLATVRTDEGAEASARLAEVADRVELGPLPAAAVAELAAAAGRPELAERIHRRTRGHPLFVVETLRGLRAGEPGVPASLQAAVDARVRRAGAAAAEVLRAAAVLGPPFELATLAATLGIDPVDAARRCEQALRAGLVVVAGSAYEFANDLVQEVLYATTPEPTRAQYHRRAAEVLADRPEAVAVHAAAVGDWLRAARARLVAAEQALGRCAFSDAERFVGPAIEAAGAHGSAELAARGHLLRGRIREALPAYEGAWADLAAAVLAAREAGDQRLEMLALRELGGDVLVSLGRSSAECEPYLAAGVRLARALGDRAMEADLLSRSAVLSCNQLRFDRGREQAVRAVAAARAAQDEQALSCALDGLKTTYAYVGDLPGLAPVLVELEPLLRRRGDLWRLQWAVFESAFGAVAAADWDAAVAGVDRALAVNERSGYLAYRPWFIAHRGWIERLRGRLDEALRWGRLALAEAAEGGHPWWTPGAAGFLGATLLAAGEPAEAAGVLEAGLAAARPDGAAAYRLRCLAPLAEATGAAGTVAAAGALLDRVAIDGGAWLLGADSYLAVARAWLAAGEPERGLAALAPLLAAAERYGWVPPLAAGLLVAGRCELRRGEPARAAELLARSGALAAAHGLPLVERAAR